MIHPVSRMSGKALLALSLACVGTAHAFDVVGVFPELIADTPSATTVFTADGQSGTWLGTVNSFFALSNDPGYADPSDAWTFTIGAGLLGSLDVTARSGPLLAGTFLDDGFGVQLAGPMTALGSGGLVVAGLTPGVYTATFTNNVDHRYPNAGGYTMTVNVAAATLPVPEPSSWALLLAGTGLLGLRSLRSRRREA